MRFLRPLSWFWTIGLVVTTAATLGLLVARFVLPHWPNAPRPQIVMLTPTNEVLPRETLTIRFSQPMNRASVVRALQIEPALPLQWNWDAEATALQLLPTTSWQPDQRYEVQISNSALDRWWRPLNQPVSISFQTARQPTVIAAFPTGPAVDPALPLSLLFSQPMVNPEQLGQPFNLPLQITPPLSTTARWLDQRTLLLSPNQLMQPATSYNAQLLETLSDLREIELVGPVEWAWSTAWPPVSGRGPSDAERQVAPSHPLTLTLERALPAELIEANLRIEPPISGSLTISQSAAGQLITFQPEETWAAEQTYRVAFGPAEAPLSVWRFTTGPEPTLVSLFPGQGQALQSGQNIRLLFSTPMEEGALLAGLTIDPPTDLGAVQINQGEVWLAPELAPSALYTLTLASDLRDAAGTPLGTEYRLPLRTAAANPQVQFPAAAQGLIALTPSSAELAIERLNLAQLDFALYRLDEPTLLRVLNLSADERAHFRPDRFGQPLLIEWQLVFNDPLDTVVQDQLDLFTLDGNGLSEGVYFLRATGPQGPAVAATLVVSPIKLSLVRSENQALLWATDASGQPLADLPIAAYVGTAQLATGRTDAQGRWSLTINGRPGQLTAISGASTVVVREQWSPSPASAPLIYRSLAFLDRHQYQPGTTITLGGFVRRINGVGQIEPPGAVGCRLLLRNSAGDSLAGLSDCSIESRTGALNATWQLEAQQALGNYQLELVVGDERSSFALEVVEFSEPTALISSQENISTAHSRLNIILEERFVLTGDRAQLTLEATQNGTAVLGQPLDLEVFPGPEVNGPPLLVRRANSDVSGRAAIELVPLNPGRYLLVATFRGEPGVRAEAELYVTSNGFQDWEASQPNLSLVADQIAYAPGDTARLLLTSPLSETTFLAQITAPRTSTSQLITLRAGQVFTVSITAEMSPTARIDVLFGTPDGLQQANAFLPITTPTQPLSLTLSTDQPDYRPGERATLALTVRDENGPQAAEVWLTLAPNSGFAAPPPDLIQALQQRYRPGLAFAQSDRPLSPTATRNLQAAPSERDELLVLGPLSVGEDGQLLSELVLPEQRGRWRIRAYVLAGSAGFATIDSEVRTSTPLDFLLSGPPRLRPNDQAEMTAIVVSPDEPRSVTFALSAQGGRLEQPSQSLRTLDLSANVPLTLTWLISAEKANELVINLRGTLDSNRWERSELRVPISVEPILPEPNAELGVLLTRMRDPQTGILLQDKNLRFGSPIELEAILILAQEVPSATLTLPLPAPFQLDHANPGFQIDPAFPDQLIWQSEMLAPGVYRWAVRGSLVGTGRYGSPAAFLQSPSGNLSDPIRLELVVE